MMDPEGKFNQKLMFCSYYFALPQVPFRSVKSLQIYSVIIGFTKFKYSQLIPCYQNWSHFLDNAYMNTFK